VSFMGAEAINTGQKRNTHSPLGLAIVSLLGVIAACLVAQVITGSQPAGAQVAGPQGAGAQGGVIAAPGQIGPDAYGLYLIDTSHRTIGVYQYLGGGLKELRLLAARTYNYDLQLDEYNTKPSPREIKSLVEQHKRLENVTTQP
jgi:hypothetical protein